MRLCDTEILKKQFDKGGIYYGTDIHECIDKVVAEHEAYEWCTGCKEYDQEKHCCHRWISHIKQAIDELKENEVDDCVLKMFGECSYNETGCSDCLVKEKISNALANHTTVYEFKGCDNCELERPKGKWIIDGHHRRCKKCNEYFCIADSEGNEIPSNFCPNCGARMEG